MKFNATIGNTTRAVGKMFFALTLLLVAVAAGFGGTALFVYHHLENKRAPATQSQAERKVAGQSRDKASEPVKDDARPRPVAATSADQPSYTYADNNGGQPSTPAKRERLASTIPAALENSIPPMDAANSTAVLNDPESHFILDSRTGRVIGIDGSAGARREEQEEQRRLEAAPRAVAVQTPPPEVRVASAVTEAGQPVYHDVQNVSADSAVSLSLPVRRALPVADATSDGARNFNVAEYMAGGQTRPVLRAQPVTSDGTRVVKSVRIYRMPDGTQIVATN